MFMSFFLEVGLSWDHGLGGGPQQTCIFPHRMHPNLTKGFGMIGPKDFFPLLDFAYMPNNSLTPRYGCPGAHLL